MSPKALPDKNLRPRHEVADIIHRFGQGFLTKNRQCLQVRKTLNAISVCRTKVLGGHKSRCNICDVESISYNSCRNRHCPKCQAVNRERWIAARESELLPVPYFHIVFTLPHLLNQLALQYPKKVYSSLFWATWQTINTFASDPKHLGAKIGMTSILHTWGQNLSLHPHIHCIVPGGGITAKGNWKKTLSNRLGSLLQTPVLRPKGRRGISG